jgi:hypothetical protein
MALVDNAKAFVLNAHPDRFAWNPTFLELCGYYCLEPCACAPRRPQTKDRPAYYAFFPCMERTLRIPAPIMKALPRVGFWQRPGGWLKEQVAFVVDASGVEHALQRESDRSRPMHAELGGDLSRTEPAAVTQVLRKLEIS